MVDYVSIGRTCSYWCTQPTNTDSAPDSAVACLHSSKGLNSQYPNTTRQQMGLFSEILALEWMDTRGVLIFIFVFLILADYLRNRSPSDFPPGPWTLPIIRDTYRVDPNKMHLNFEEVCLLQTTINGKRLLFKKLNAPIPPHHYLSPLIDNMLSVQFNTCPH